MSSRTVNATETIKQSLHFILHFAGKQNCAFLFFPFSPPPFSFFFFFFCFDTTDDFQWTFTKVIKEFEVTD